MGNENVVAVWKNARMQLLMMMAERGITERLRLDFIPYFSGQNEHVCQFRGAKEPLLVNSTKSECKEM